MFSSSSVHAEILDATVLTRISTTQQYLILYISTLLFHSQATAEVLTPCRIML